MVVFCCLKRSLILKLILGDTHRYIQHIMITPTHPLTLSPVDSTQHIFLPIFTSSIWDMCGYQGWGETTPASHSWVRSYWQLLVAAGEGESYFLGMVVTGECTHASLAGPTLMHIQATLIGCSGILKKKKKNNKAAKIVLCF